MINLGTIRPGRTIYLPFESFASSTGAPITLTGLAVGDIKIYKDGSTTERASTAGITLLDTDGIDFDGLTGIHGVSIDLSDNTTAGFYTAGSRYFVVIGDVTVDSQTMRFVWGAFHIGYEHAVLDTTIATLASQTSFTLATGSADNSSYVGSVVVVHDAASAVQLAMGVVSAYTGATKTVTLAADPAIFTMAAGDNVSILPRTSVYAIAGTAQTARDMGASVLLSSGTGTGQVSLSSGTVSLTADQAVNVTKWGGTAIASAYIQANTAQLAGQTVTAASGVTFPSSVASPTNITAGTITTVTNLTNLPAIPADWLTAAGIASDAGTELGTAVWAAATRTLTSAGSSGATAQEVWEYATRTLSAGTNIVLVKGVGVTGFTDLDAAGVRTAVGLASANLDTQVAAVKADTAAILDDTGTSGVVVASGSKTGYSLTQSFPPNFASLAISAGGLASINLAQVGLTPRALDAIADGALTVGDALVSAIAVAAGKETVVSTAYTVRTPYTGTVIRTFTLDSATDPTSRT